MAQLSKGSVPPLSEHITSTGQYMRGRGHPRTPSIRMVPADSYQEAHGRALTRCHQNATPSSQEPPSTPREIPSCDRGNGETRWTYAAEVQMRTWDQPAPLPSAWRHAHCLLPGERTGRHPRGRGCAYQTVLAIGPDQSLAKMTREASYASESSVRPSAWPPGPDASPDASPEGSSPAASTTDKAVASRQPAGASEEVREHRA